MLSVQEVVIDIAPHEAAKLIASGIAKPVSGVPIQHAMPPQLSYRVNGNNGARHIQPNNA